MALIWRILYGFVVLLGNNTYGFGKPIETQKYNLVTAKGDSLTNNCLSDVNEESKILPREDKKLKDDIIKLLMKRNADKSVVRLLLRALQDDATYRDYTKRDHPITFLYHKTLKKVERNPSKFKDENSMLTENRIRVAPMGLESPEQPDMPLALAKLVDLNSLIENAAIRASSSDRSKSYEKLNNFLYEANLKSNKNFSKFKMKGKKKHDGLVQDENGESLKKKREIMRMLLAAYPMQFCLVDGGLLHHYLEKYSTLSFRPDQFMMGISKDPAFSPSNDVGEHSGDEAPKQITQYQNDKKFFKFNKDSISLLNQTLSENKLDEVALKKAVLSQDIADKIHQSAEDTVFKRVLNELISDVPNYEGLSTYRPVENINYANDDLKEPDRIKEIESRVKSAKHTQENLSPTTSKESYPCMKIRVKNGPVILTFQSDTRVSSTRKPYTDPSNVPVFKLLSDKITDSNANATAYGSLHKNTLAELTEDSNYEESSRGLIGRANTSNYYFGSDIDTEKSNYFEENLFTNTNKTNGLDDPSLIYQPKCANTSTGALQNSIINLRHNFEPVLFNSSIKRPEYKLKNLTENYNKAFSNNSDGMPYDFKDYFSNDRFEHKKSASVACPIRTDSFILPDIKVQRFGVPRNLFLTRSGSDYYKLSHSPYYYRFGSNCSHCGGDSYWRYVPKVYYNDLVVSKGLVGQHPSREESAGAMLSDSTLKKMEMLNILKFYLDSLSPERNYTSCRSKDPSNFNPMLNHNRKYFIKM